MSASREAQKFEDYAALIRRWNPAINLIAASSLAELETRHIADCAQLATLASPTSGKWLDIGSGGGLPGLVIAISRPDLSVILVDSDQRKCAFLRSCVRELGLDNCTIVAARVEALPPAEAANLSARALAPLGKLMPYVKRHLAPAGTAWLMKGLNWRKEVEMARSEWHFDFVAHPSITQEGAAILEIRDLYHV